MFTGIILEIGHIKILTKSDAVNKIVVHCSHILPQAAIGDSIAVNGVCLTVVDLTPTSFEADVSDETWARSNLSLLSPSDPVNLEHALRIGGKVGGHFVQGHVDGLGHIKSIKKQAGYYDYVFTIPADMEPYLVEKGSIAINGISLTISQLKDNSFSCAIIPHTQQNTNLKFLKAGAAVNIELDILAKYVFRMLKKTALSDNQPADRKSIDEKFLMEHGFL
ncbi:riboflavin synthase [candidate division CSSED10-310 bacterium]|uniref:Riboflavin synthase n=1 Tax=candidate division CSSED10-310 bacterium TaxID=2855610 RepID=A0ABV6Z1W4_UNCC1